MAINSRLSSIYTTHDRAASQRTLAWGEVEHSPAPFDLDATDSECCPWATAYPPQLDHDGGLFCDFPPRESWKSQVKVWAHNVQLTPEEIRRIRFGTFTFPRNTESGDRRRYGEEFVSWLAARNVAHYLDWHWWRTWKGCGHVGPWYGHLHGVVIPTESVRAVVIARMWNDVTGYATVPKIEPVKRTVGHCIAYASQYRQSVEEARDCAHAWGALAASLAVPVVQPISWVIRNVDGPVCVVARCSVPVRRGNAKYCKVHRRTSTWRCRDMRRRKGSGP